MFCTACGSENQTGAKFCIKCQHPLPEPEPHLCPNGHPLSAGAERCAVCDSAMGEPPGHDVNSGVGLAVSPTLIDDSLAGIEHTVKQPPNATASDAAKHAGFAHQVGERIGVYTLEEPMGVGGFAEVWKALETTANRSVALKVFFDRVMVDPEQARIFRLEAQKQARLEHERVTPIYYCHLDPQHGPGPYYIAMKLMPGGTLEALLRTKKKLPPAEALAILRDVLQGLEVAHSAGIIHRDIKPRNVLFDKHGRATLADFGIAKDLSADTHTLVGTVMGTPEYMSPEQSMGQPVTRATDIYSIGVMLYEMLSGKPPYTGRTITAIMMARQQAVPATLFAAVPGISARLQEVVLTCLEQEPSRRFANCEALLRALDSVDAAAAAGPATPELKPPPKAPSRPEPPPPAQAGVAPPRGPLAAPAPQPKSGSGRNYALLAAAVVLLLIGGWWFGIRRTSAPGNGAVDKVEIKSDAKPIVNSDVKTDPQADLKSVGDWTKILWDNPLLGNCRSYQPCIDRSRLVEKIKSADFSKVAREDPLRRDCAGWDACLKVFPAAAPSEPAGHRACTLEVAEFDLPAACPAGDDFCKSCKQKQGIPDGTGMQK